MDQKRNRIADVTLGILITISLSLSGWIGRTQVAQGELIATVRQIVIGNSEDIHDIKITGSPALQALTKSLQAEIEARREADNVMSKRIEDSRSDFSQRCQNITGLLEKQVEQETALIALIRAQNQLKQ